MLKGLKKSKPVQQSQKTQFINKPNDSSKVQQQMQIQPAKLIRKNQKDLKNQFMMQQQNNINNYHIETWPVQLKEDSLQSKLKQKALQILKLYQLGNQSEVFEKLTKFQQIQASYFRSISQTQLNFKQNPNIILKSQLRQQRVKGKFQYTMNFQQSQQQVDRKSKKRSHKSRPIMRSQKVQDYCMYCPDNQQLKLISASNYVYLALCKKKTFKKYWHFILGPVQHHQSSIGLNNDITKQINNYKKCLVQMFDKKNNLIIFFQQFSKQSSHIYIQCLAVPYVKGQDFPFFFKQSMQSVEGNWTTHKNIIKIQKQKGGIQKQIPKKMKYFYIDFSLGYGYAHVIQNQQYWKRDFSYQILATALGIELYQIKTAAQYTDQELDNKDNQFKKMWEPYDWTKYL